MVPAHADDTDVGALHRVKVDLTAIVDTGVSHPVENISSSGQPGRAAFEVFAKSGYVAVVDLRGADEDRGLDEHDVVEGLGMQYVTLPIVGEDAVSYENAQKLDTLLSELDGPVLLHCVRGNRVGALLALRHSQSGASDEEALAFGKKAGLTRLEPVVQERLEAK